MSHCLSIAQNIVWYVSNSPILFLVSPCRGISSLFAMSQLLQIYDLPNEQFEMSYCVSFLQDIKLILSHIALFLL